MGEASGRHCENSQGGVLGGPVMSLLRNLAGGLRGLFRKAQVEREMDEELPGYLDDSANEKIRRGMRPRDAERAARNEKGGEADEKEQLLRVGWGPLLEA